jgi:hypothetical protein
MRLRQKIVLQCGDKSAGWAYIEAEEPCWQRFPGARAGA